ncbi:hypothetical protein [Paracoccus sp. (in: a-proteobacteria)]|uniref:hypothetical protein n=1 Tax=Paracoccus sp. TaxID=267 RepID=UPI0026E00052|nr:hypothetical protein [Paracoccus sp. (in: a-proteobacteria)]MDO5648729.1 hypothetical protein [Paracoccus sp. (in: a-proteobacteria)]
MTCAVLALISAPLVAAGYVPFTPQSEMLEDYQRMMGNILEGRETWERRPSTTAPASVAGATGDDYEYWKLAFSSRRHGETAARIIQNGLPCRDIMTQVRATEMGWSSPVIQTELASGALYLAGAISTAKLDNPDFDELMPAFIAFCDVDDSRSLHDFMDSLTDAAH